MTTGCHPRWTMNAHPKVRTNPVVEDRLSRLQKVQHKAQVTHKRLADRHRLDSLKKFLIGDHVWLLQHNIRPLDLAVNWITNVLALT